MTQTVSLAAQLARFKEDFKSRMAPATVATMEAATAALKASGIEGRARRVGEAAPDVTLPDALGRPVRLSRLWRQGPLVVVFYRGGWCPYCNLELRAWQERLPELQTLGARLVAISPETPDNSLSTAQKHALAYPVLSDSGLDAARGFDIAFTLPPELIDLYGLLGHDLPVLNGNGQWVLPVPATFVIGRDGRVTYAHVDVDYRERAEPGDVIAAVRSRQPVTDC